MLINASRTTPAYLLVLDDALLRRKPGICGDLASAAR